MSVESLYKAMGLTSSCAHCGKPVRQGHLYCDRWCQVELRKTKNAGETK